MGDDAALLRAGAGYETILTCDWFLEGTHFLKDIHPADAVGWRCLARAVSDVAAMGGAPRCFLLSLALPATHTGRWLDQFLRGLRRAARKFECVLAGGDTTRDERILINVTVVGEVPAGKAVRRSGARPGDVIFVSGRLGEAELGLRLLRRGGKWVGDPLLRKHLYPEPRLAQGRWLAERGVVTAMMDLSDGLSTDLPRLCSASGVGARIEAAKLPVVLRGREKMVRAPDRASGARKKERGGRSLDPVELALNGGDDYELLFTVSPLKLRKLRSARLPGRITPIGVITGGKDIHLVHADGREERLRSRGWDPFRAE